MFLSSKNRLRALLDTVDDLLAPHPDEVAAGDGWPELPVAELCGGAPRAVVDAASSDRRSHGARPLIPDTAAAVHPHRQPLRWEPRRRAGALPAPAAHCISPVRRSAASEPRATADRADGGR